MVQRTVGIDQLVAWLDDAYAMETGLISILESHASHFDRIPAAARRIEQHIVETQQHAQRLRECLRQLDASPSTIKSTVSSVMGTIEGTATTLFRDRRVKDVLTDYASEQFEVGCYTALVKLAADLGQMKIAQLCKTNLEEDLEMASWLLEQVPKIVARDAG
jgi:ferritin-like metal-binding protein YciE